MIDPVGFNPDQNLSFAGLRNWSFENPKFTNCRDFDCFVRSSASDFLTCSTAVACLAHARSPSIAITATWPALS